MARFFSGAPDRELAISEFSLYSIGYILTEREQIPNLRRFVTDVLVEGHVTRVRLTGEELYSVLRAVDRFRLDFDDAYQYVAAVSRELKLVSFDDDFDRTDIERLEPQDVLDARR